MSVGLVHGRQRCKLQRVIVPGQMPPGKGLGGDEVWWTLVEDAHVAGHLATPAEPRPLQCFHRYTDDAGWETTQAQTLDVS